MPDPTAQADISPVKPVWLRKRLSFSPSYEETLQTAKSLGLNTVCVEAACPNIAECWSKKHMTVMILGDTCTRACRFCNVKTGVPNAVNPQEPKNLATAIGRLGLRHVVITSVDRDDLEDGGATQFLLCIEELRKSATATSIEILTPDFLRKPKALGIIMQNPPDVFNHNIETVPRLYRSIRPGSRYFQSLRLLSDAKNANSHIFTKSGLMVGLGEEDCEIFQVMDDLRAADVDFLTIGQYLQPTPNHAKVKRFVKPEEFDNLKIIAESKGFLMVAAGPFVRSSYHADSDFEQLKLRRNQGFRIHKNIIHKNIKNIEELLGL